MTRHVVDPSVWSEYVAGRPSAEHFAPIVEKPEDPWVPTITLFESAQTHSGAAGRKRRHRLRGAVMQQGEVIAIGAVLALQAAKLGVKHRLPMAESLVYTAANVPSHRPGHKMLISKGCRGFAISPSNKKVRAQRFHNLHAT